MKIRQNTMIRIPAIVNPDNKTECFYHCFCNKNGHLSDCHFQCYYDKWKIINDALNEQM